MKKIKFLALCAIAAGVVTSCQKDEISNEVQPESSAEVTELQKQALLDAGVNPAGAELVTITHPGESPQEYLMSGDILLPTDVKELAKQALEDAADGFNKQYRTSNLVSSNNYNISVIGYTGSGFALTSTMQTALQWAVNNYNRLNIGLNFTLSYAASTNADMVVYNNGASGGGGSAGFPNGGQPHKFIQINAGTDAFGTNVVEHVITHEMGHSVGFRHTDYASRQSCGSNQNEGQAGVGAILIPGTSGSDTTPSIMLACFGGNEDGEFENSDITALEFMY
ncbi:hypothetical protein GCM10022393_11170 [Aquimarina addita]|uniref:Peptidase n=1 Tax=Aquimarina addita TaxID=870485 RepID=A0ABP7XEM4_9FLAO